MDEITAFVDSLSAHEPTDSCFNPYYGPSLEAQICRHNLTQYLADMLAQRPRVIFVGEAPGYAGCAKTGIPFTSERQLAGDPFFSVGYRIQSAEKGLPDVQSENTANCVWACYRRAAGMIPLMWNIFPFHPHEPGNPNSNRAPSSQEVALGYEIFKRLNAIFGELEVYAIGRKAQRIPGAKYVRHPSRGGSKTFAAQASEILCR